MAAGVKAALLFLKGEYCEQVELAALDGTRLFIPVKKVMRTPGGARAEIIKDAGDDPDITQGVSVYTTIRLRPDQKEIIFHGGRGIGYVTKPGLSAPVGGPAINPGPRQMVRQVVDELLGPQAGLEVIVAIPAGLQLAKRTLNPLLGIRDGISVIGTTGVLRPMSEESFKNSLVVQLDVARAAGYHRVVFVPGKIGADIAVNVCGLPMGAVIQISNFVGFMLEAAVHHGIRQVLFVGHPGKLLKVAAGVFHTHNRVADARMETLAAYAAAEGMPSAGVRRILSAATTEEAMPVIAEYGLERVYRILAERVSQRAVRYVFHDLYVGTVFATLQGKILGMDHEAEDIGEAFHWNIKSL